MPRKFLYLLHPEAGQEAGSDNPDDGSGEQNLSANTETPDTETPDTSEDVAKLKEALRKEREVSAAADKRAKAAEKQARDAQTTGKTVEERVALIEKENSDLKLANQQSKAVEDAIGKVEKGYKVDRATLLEELSDMNITAENVEAVVARAVKRNTKPDSTLPTHQNTQGRSDGEPSKMDPKKPRTVGDVFG